MINPLPGYCIIEPIDEEMKTTSGLVIPDSAKDRPLRGKIVAISPIVSLPREFVVLGDTTMAAEYKNLAVGKVVYHRKWGGEEIKQGEKKYRVVKYEDVMAYE